MNLTRSYGFVGSQESDIQAVFDFLNSFSEVISFEVTVAGTEVLIPHKLEAIPRQVFPVILEGDTASFANVFAGTTAWTTSEVYLTASLPGTYRIILRR